MAPPGGERRNKLRVSAVSGDDDTSMGGASPAAYTPDAGKMLFSPATVLLGALKIPLLPVL